MLTKIELTDIDGATLHEVECAIVETRDYDDRHQAIIWNGRVFAAYIDIPDCDAPENYMRCFEEVPVVAVVSGDKRALVAALDALRQA
jgi:hypothetical protein